MEKMQFHFVPVVLEGRIYNQTNNSREMLKSFNNRKDFYYEIYPDNNRFSNTISKNEPYNKLEFLSIYCGCTWGYKGNPYLSTGCESKFWLLIFIFNLQKNPTYIYFMMITLFWKAKSPIDFWFIRAGSNPIYLVLRMAKGFLNIALISYIHQLHSPTFYLFIFVQLYV